MKRLSIDDMQALARLQGGKCLSKEYKNSHVKLIWQCSSGHQWKATPTNIKQGKWCPFCSGKRQTIEDMRELARHYDGVCLSSEYHSAKIKLQWKCKNGHVWEARPDNVKHGNWCPICSKKKAAAKRMGSILEVRTVAKERDGKCLSDKYLGNNVKLKWECKHGHIWEATPGNIKSGKWCPVCAGNQKNTIDKIDRLARLKGGRCLSTIYVNRRHKLQWQCKERHTWETPAGSIISGRWCPECAIKKRSDALRGSIKEMQAIAEERGGKCLSGKYINSNSRLLWECAHGHSWKATPGSVKSGTWCPECSAGLGERICREFMEQLFDDKFPKVRPKWLKSPEGTQLELDGYCSKLKLAFEHQGAQHFEIIDRFHTKETAFDRGQYLDDCKRRLCEKKGSRLLEILEVPRYTPIGELKEYIKQECLSLGVMIPDNFETKAVELKNAYCKSGQNKYTELQKIAMQRGGKLLSEAYFNERVKLRWECELGHIWEAAPYVIRRGSWCKKCASAIVADRQRGSIEEYKAIAKARGGKCLSTEYVNVMTKLKWECSKGHVWKAVPNNIRNGQWCPICGVERRADAQRGTISEMRRIAEDRGGSCFSDKYVNSTTKLRWQCSEGHIWEARPGNIKFGQWCPICAHRKPKIKKDVEHDAALDGDSATLHPRQ